MVGFGNQPVPWGVSFLQPSSFHLPYKHLKITLLQIMSFNSSFLRCQWELWFTQQPLMWSPLTSFSVFSFLVLSALKQRMLNLNMIFECCLLPICVVSNSTPVNTSCWWKPSMKENIPAYGWQMQYAQLLSLNVFSQCFLQEINPD